MIRFGGIKKRKMPTQNRGKLESEEALNSRYKMDDELGCMLTEYEEEADDENRKNKEATESESRQSNSQLLKTIRESQSLMGYWEYDECVIDCLDLAGSVQSYLSKYRNKKL